MTTKVKFRILAAAVVFALAAILFVQACSRPRVVRLANGVSLEWLGVTMGTNSFKHGSPLEKLLGDLIPAAGLEIATFRLARPRVARSVNDSDATLWFQLRGDAALLPPHAYNWKGSTVVTSNRTGRSISIPTARWFAASSNEVLMNIPLRAFPRDQKTFIVRISPPIKDGRQREWVEFEFPNPFRVRRTPAWVGSAAPITNLQSGFEFVLDSAQPAQAAFRVPDTNWTVVNCAIRDEEGNFTSWSKRKGPNLGSRQVDVWFDHGLETNRVWSVEATCLRASGWPNASREFPSEEHRSIQVIGTSSGTTATNTAGAEFLWNLEGNQLRVIRRGGLSRPHWIVLSATNENNQAIDISGGAGWTRQGPDAPAVQVWHLPNSPKQLDLQVVCPREEQVQFFVRPAAN